MHITERMKVITVFMRPEPQNQKCKLKMKQNLFCSIFLTVKGDFLELEKRSSVFFPKIATIVLL